MRRALLVASIVSAFAVACSEDKRAQPIPSQQGTDTGLPIVEAGNNDTGTPPIDSGTPTDSTVPDTTPEDTGTPPGDATFSDIVSTKDTAIDAIILEVGGGSDGAVDTELPDVLSFFDTAVEDVDAR
jgi:hypothetical protein